MSLVVQSFTNTAATAGSGTVNASSTTGTTATGGPFAQTLVQTMGGEMEKLPAAPLLGNLASLLQGLMNLGQPADDTTAEENTTLETLEGLVQDLESLDENIGNDPVLMAALQGWLVQVAELFSGSSESGGTAEGDGTAEAAAAISPLAQHADTLRFAVQDDLTRLVSLIQEASSSGNTKDAAQGISLLNQLAPILEQTSLTANSKAAAAMVDDAKNGILTASEVAGKVASVSESESQSSRDVRIMDPVNTKKEPVLAGASAKKEPAVSEGARTATTAQPKGTVGIETKAAASPEEIKPDVKVASQEHEVVTVGQLALRGGITAPLKAETPSVPVHQFSKEMTNLIKGKLDIVQKGGIAEASITLFPENLGQVDVKISMHNGHLVAQFLTEHGVTKDLLEQQMTQLRAALQSQGLQIEKLEVTQNNTPLQSQLNQEGRQPGSGGQQSNKRSPKGSREESNDAILAAELNGEWKEWNTEAAQEHSARAGSFSAKA